MNGRRLLEGAGAGILLTLGLTWNNLSTWHLDLYGRQLPINTVVRAIAIDLVLISLACAGLLWLLERVDRNDRTLLWALFASALAARALGGLAAVEVLDREGVTPVRTFAAFLILWLLLWIFARRWYSLGVRGFRFFLLVLGFCIFWMLPELVWLGFAHQPQDELAYSRPVAAQAAPHRRVVWLLFDEMSYDQLFDHRWPGLEMPNFDRLRGESVNFSQVQPEGFYTSIVVPSLLLGQPISDVRSSTAGYLYLRASTHDPWQGFDPSGTLFAEAKQMGWTTGMVSWSLPQCRLMPQLLDTCWMQMFPFGDHLSGQQSTFDNVVAPARVAFAKLVHQPHNNTQSPTEMMDALMDAAQSLAADDNIDFAFIHLPVPHPRGIYHRATGKIGYGGSYIDNLALSDKLLGELEDTLAKTPSASMTTLIVSSDHSWRVPIWRNKSGWTREDEEASKGRFEPRPVLMVHFPGETASVAVDQPFPILKEHGLVDSLLHHPMTATDLEDWVHGQ
jgi:Sulfatase